MPTKVMFVHPWNYHDEGVTSYNPATSWRNGPYNIALLGTVLREAGHDVKVVDLEPKLIGFEGNVNATLNHLYEITESYQPDIIGITFFSVNYLEVKKIMQGLRDLCPKLGFAPLFIAGGIHASVAPETCISDLLFDYAFVGEGEIGICEIASGVLPHNVQGVFLPDSDEKMMRGVSPKQGLISGKKAQYSKDLDSLPFVDWGLTDHKFYAFPSSARLGFEAIGSLDMEMGRGCVYKCSFCAYNALSGVRFHSAEYLVEQMVFNRTNFGVNAFYFTDSTIGNNRRVIREMCEIILRKGLENEIKWLANIRSNQVNEEDLKLMWRAGCRFLLYGFESNSQRMLDAMQKSCKVESNERAAELHSRLNFPYTASMLFGFPGETEQDLYSSIDFLKRHKPPSSGINWYVPLPGSPDYDALRAVDKIVEDGPEVWRRLGEVNDAVCYADVDPKRFKEIYDEACNLAYNIIPNEVWENWKLRYNQSAQINNDLPITSTFKNVYSHTGKTAKLN